VPINAFVPLVNNVRITFRNLAQCRKGRAQFTRSSITMTKWQKLNAEIIQESPAGSDPSDRERIPPRSLLKVRMKERPDGQGKV